MMLSASSVPQMMLSASSPAVPQMMLSSPSVPQMMLSSLPAVPQMMLSASPSVPQMMLSQSAPPQSVPQMMFSPVFVRATPQVVPSANAFADGSRTPPDRRWLPQMIFLLQAACIGYGAAGWAVAKNRARRTAPSAFKKPAPCVNAL